jgi:uncharacterized membrane protein YhaH (DUF805 family)
MQHDTSYTIANIIVWGLIYFLPALVASGRRHHNALAIFILDLLLGWTLLGWTLLGWVIALVWACTRPQRNIDAKTGKN